MQINWLSMDFYLMVSNISATFGENRHLRYKTTENATLFRHKLFWLLESSVEH